MSCFKKAKEMNLEILVSGEGADELLSSFHYLALTYLEMWLVLNFLSQLVVMMTKETQLKKNTRFIQVSLLDTMVMDTIGQTS